MILYRPIHVDGSTLFFFKGDHKSANWQFILRPRRQDTRTVMYTFRIKDIREAFLSSD